MSMQREEGESSSAGSLCLSACPCVCVRACGDQSVFLLLLLRKRRRIENANHVANKKIKGKSKRTDGHTQNEVENQQQKLHAQREFR